MYKLYHGGGGPPRRVEEPQESVPFTRRPPFPPRPERADPIRQAAEALLGRISGELETEDLILLLMLYLLYRESGDTEMLFILGAMILL